jgi:hypothetical protein
MNIKDVLRPGRVCALILLVSAPIGVRAQLTYENINGTGLIYDAVDKVYWTQDADVSGTSHDFADAQTWAANLDYAGIGAGNWQLPNNADFTYMFSQLPANGSDGTDRYGAQQSFGGGPNDYVSNVQPEYWTDADGTDFNFFYGYPGGQPDANLYPTWAVTTTPEPTAASLGLAATGLVAWRWRRARK